jgi:4-alpha-glucanotransferase
MDDLATTAQRWGVEPEYHDVFGSRHTASADTLRRLIAAISVGREHPYNFGPAPEATNATRAYQGDGRRLWALMVQLYALRSRRNWGHGDFTDLSQLIAIAAAHGAAGVGLNPLHALFIDRAEQASPYAPNSRLYLNPLYIDVEAIPDFPGLTAGLNGQVAALRDGDFIAYPHVAAAKLHGLKLAYARFRRAASAARRADFESFRADQGEALLRFACFETLRRQYAPAPWTEWPQPWRNPDLPDLQMFRNAHEEHCEFHEFVQWVADRQLAACQEAAHRHGMPVGLYIDVAVGLDRHGADAWTNHGAVLENVSIGAPPDEFNPGGQDWGLAPFNPHALPRHDYRQLRELLRAAMRHAGAIRLDHVLGLQRMFMIPLGQPASEGTYVRFPFQHLLRVVTEASNLWRCIVVGEDLGTVPQHFRETLARWGLWSYRVMLFEREHDGRFRPPDAYPVEALASFNTHDLPSFRGWMAGHDLRVKRAIAFDPGESDEARARSRDALKGALAKWTPSFSSDDISAVAAFLAATHSRLVTIALDDILGVLDQVNIPGTVDQHPNWQRKLPVTIEQLAAHDGMRRVAEVFAKGGRSFNS